MTTAGAPSRIAHSSSWEASVAGRGKRLRIPHGASASTGALLQDHQFFGTHQACPNRRQAARTLRTTPALEREVGTHRRTARLRIGQRRTTATKSGLHVSAVEFDSLRRPWNSLLTRLSCQRWSSTSPYHEAAPVTRDITGRLNFHAHLRTDYTPTRGAIVITSY